MPTTVQGKGDTALGKTTVASGRQRGLRAHGARRSEEMDQGKLAAKGAPQVRGRALRGDRRVGWGGVGESVAVPLRRATKPETWRLSRS